MQKLSLKELQELQFSTFEGIDTLCRKNNIIYYLIGGTLLGAVRNGGFIPWDDDMDIAMLREDYDKFLGICETQLDDSLFLQNYHTDVDFSPALSRICIKGTYVDIKSTEHLKFNKSTYIDVFPLDNIPDDDALAFKQAKDLSRIDKLINLKLYAVYNEGFLKYKKRIKKIISFLLEGIPLDYLQNKREKVMTKYSSDKTKRVCSTVSKYGYKKQMMDAGIYGTPSLVKFESGEFFAPEKYKEYLTQIYGNYMEMPEVGDRIMPVDVYRSADEKI